MNYHRRRFLNGLITLIATLGSVRTIQAASKRGRHKPGTDEGNPSPTPAPTATPTPEPSPVPTDDAAPDASSGKEAQLRIWKASDRPDSPIQVRLLPHGKPDSAAIKFDAETGNYRFANYVDVPAGPMMLEISAPDSAIVRLPAYQAAGGAATLLIRQTGANLTAEWLDDSPDRDDKTFCDFSIHNLLPASGDILITMGDSLSVHLTSTRGSLSLKGVKRGLYQISTSGTDGKGKPFTWSTEADFRHFRKLSLLIYTDTYGRIRPRVNTN